MKKDNIQYLCKECGWLGFASEMRHMPITMHDTGYDEWVFGGFFCPNCDNLLFRIEPTESPSIAENELLPNLQKVVDILDRNKIHFWMYGGALLGYVRDGKLIPWNKDIDLFVWSNDYPKIRNLRKEFSKIGIKILVKEKTLRLWWGKRNEYGIDILYYTLNEDFATLDRLNTNISSPIKLKLGNLIYFTVFIKSVEYNMNMTYRFLKWLLLKFNLCYVAKQIVPSHFFLDLKEINFFGIKLKVPAETEDYLEYTFGLDWRIPKKDFQYNPKYFMRLV